MRCFSMLLYNYSYFYYFLENAAPAPPLSNLPKTIQNFWQTKFIEGENFREKGIGATANRMRSWVLLLDAAPPRVYPRPQNLSNVDVLVIARTFTAPFHLSISNPFFRCNAAPQYFL